MLLQRKPSGGDIMLKGNPVMLPNAFDLALKRRFPAEDIKAHIYQDWIGISAVSPPNDFGVFISEQLRLMGEDKEKVRLSISGDCAVCCMPRDIYERYIGMVVEEEYSVHKAYANKKEIPRRPNCSPVGRGIFRDGTPILLQPAFVSSLEAKLSSANTRIDGFAKGDEIVISLYADPRDFRMFETFMQQWVAHAPAGNKSFAFFVDNNLAVFSMPRETYEHAFGMVSEMPHRGESIEAPPPREWRDR